MRILYAYLLDIPVERIPYINIPAHTVFKLEVGRDKTKEMRY
jgi:hypothetical protein